MEDVADAIKLFLTSLGEDVSRKSLLNTPKRVIEGYQQILFGYKINLKDVIQNKFSCSFNNEIIIFDEIKFFSVCEHHFIPFFGKIRIAYMPNQFAIGFGTINRLVEAITRRLQLQENIANQIASIIQESALNPLGVFVFIEGNHFCTLSKNPHDSHPLLVKNFCTTKDFKKQENIQKLELILNI